MADRTIVVVENNTSDLDVGLEGSGQCAYDMLNYQGAFFSSDALRAFCGKLEEYEVHGDESHGMVICVGAVHDGGGGGQTGKQDASGC